MNEEEKFEDEDTDGHEPLNLKPYKESHKEITKKKERKTGRKKKLKKD